MAFVSKISKAREIYDANLELGRNELVNLLVTSLGLNKGTATTYYYSLIKGDGVEAKKPVAKVVLAPVVEAPKKRGRPAKAKVDPIVAAAPVVAPKREVKPIPKYVEPSTTGGRREAGQMALSQLEIDFRKDPENWVRDMARLAEEAKNELTFGKKN